MKQKFVIKLSIVLVVLKYSKSSHVVDIYFLVGDQAVKKNNDMMKRQVSGSYKILMKGFLVLETLTDVLEDELMVLKMCVVDIELAKKMLKEEGF